MNILVYIPIHSHNSHVLVWASINVLGFCNDIAKETKCSKATAWDYWEMSCLTLVRYLVIGKTSTPDYVTAVSAQFSLAKSPDVLQGGYKPLLTGRNLLLPETGHFQTQNGLDWK